MDKKVFTVRQNGEALAIVLANHAPDALQLARIAIGGGGRNLEVSPDAPVDVHEFDALLARRGGDPDARVIVLGPTGSA